MQENSLIHRTFDCPVCLQILVNVVTLPCGHSFCQICIRNTYFTVQRSVCPLCRKQIVLNTKCFQVNMILDQIIQQHFSLNEVHQFQYYEKDYKIRRIQINSLVKIKKTKLAQRILREMVIIYNRITAFQLKLTPLFSIVMMILLIFSIRQTLLNKRLKVLESNLGEELIKIVQILKKEDLKEFTSKDEDIKTLVSSKLVKYIFTNCLKF